MKMVSLDENAQTLGGISWDEMKKLGEITFYDKTMSEQVNERIADADVIFTTKVSIGAENMKHAPNLKYIGVFATGYNVIDIKEAKKSNITVCNVPAYSTEPVAQHVFALILELCNRVGDYNADVRERWVNSPLFTYYGYPLTELSGKTLGIIGYGSIGKRVAQIAKAFGMNVIYTKRTEPKEQDDTAKFVSLEQLLSDSDILTLHCPLNDSTRGLINESTIAKMKESAIIINTSRGPVIDEYALAKALNSGKIKAAGLDVLSAEPPKKENPLLTAKNCLLTPHIAWASPEARQRLMDISVANLKAFLANKPQNVVAD